MAPSQEETQQADSRSHLFSLLLSCSLLFSPFLSSSLLFSLSLSLFLSFLSLSLSFSLFSLFFSLGFLLSERTSRVSQVIFALGALQHSYIVKDQ